MKRWQRLALLGAALYFTIALYGRVHAAPMLANPGTLMSPAAPVSSGPPPVTYNIQTEAGDNLTTEAGDHLVTEDAP